MERLGRGVKHWAQRMNRRKAKKAAMVAAARKWAESIWRLFALGEAFDLRRVFPYVEAAPRGLRPCPRPPAAPGKIEIAEALKASDAQET